SGDRIPALPHRSRIERRHNTDLRCTSSTAIVHFRRCPDLKITFFVASAVVGLLRSPLSSKPVADMWRVLAAGLTRGAPSKDLIFCVDAGFCFIRKMAVALAGPVRSWSPPLPSRRRSLTSKPHAVLVPPSSPARGFSPNFLTTPV